MNAPLIVAAFALVGQGVDLDEELRREVRAGNYHLAEKLLENPEVSPDSQDAQGETALMYAVRAREPHLIPLLIKAGADLDRVNRDGETALILAVRRGNVEAARQLLMAGADVSLRDASGRTALDWAEKDKRTYLSQIIRISSRPSLVRVTVAEKAVDLGSDPLVPPKVVKEIPPLYTQDAFSREIEGRVVLKVIVRKDGSVGPIRVHQGLDKGLDEAAMEAVRKWRFDPAQLRGEPINVLTNVEFDFVIQRPKKETGVRSRTPRAL